MWARQTRPAVSARAGGGLRVYQCARYLPLGGKLIEQLGELICQDAIPACEHKNQDWEQPRPPGQVMGPISICVSQVWEQARLGAASPRLYLLPLESEKRKKESWKQ